MVREGYVEDGAVYTTEELARLLGYRQSRSVEDLLDRAGCPVVRFGRKRLVSGYRFRIAIERCFDGQSEN